MDLSLKKKKKKKKKKDERKGKGKGREREKGEWENEKKKNKQKAVAQCFLSGRVETGYPKFHCPTNGSQNLEVLLPPQNTAGYQGAKSHCYLY